MRELGAALPPTNVYMPVIRKISSRRVLNSHVQFTNEFIVEFDDGSVGSSASSKGETIGIYEDRHRVSSREQIVSVLERECVSQDLQQVDFDSVLAKHLQEFGRDNCCALSLSFFNASRASGPTFEAWSKAENVSAPCLCCNIINGGWHAYTNPVLSDFPEFLFVSRNNNIEDVIAAHNEIQRVVREELQALDVKTIGGNSVHCFSTADNRQCIEFLLKIREKLGAAREFDLMIDASAGDLWGDEKYELALTTKGRFSPAEFGQYWLGLINDYDILFLEDPLRETDTKEWQQLTASTHKCQIIGDNFYCSDAGRIERGVTGRYSHGVVIKPNQAGTVTAVRRAVEAAQDGGQTVITSHRSISTEDTFISTLTCLYNVRYIKIGPLFTDYSSVVRLNAILRLSEAPEYNASNQDLHDSARVH